MEQPQLSSFDAIFTCSGILNSALSFRFFADTCAGLEGAEDRYLRFKRQYVEAFPIRTIDFTSPADVARHDRMVSLVERMLDLHKKLASEGAPHVKTVFQRQIEAHGLPRSTGWCMSCTG